jgi:hypothetical protein
MAYVQLTFSRVKTLEAIVFSAKILPAKFSLAQDQGTYCVAKICFGATTKFRSLYCLTKSCLSATSSDGY